jgi:hypothetical protein
LNEYPNGIIFLQGLSIILWMIVTKMLHRKNLLIKVTPGSSVWHACYLEYLTPNVTDPLERST